MGAYRQAQTDDDKIRSIKGTAIMAERDYGALLEQLNQGAPTPSVQTPIAEEPEQSLVQRAWNVISGKKDENSLNDRGIRTEGAPLSTRAKAGMPTDDASRSIAAMKDLGDQAEFKLDHETKRLLYKLPGEESFNTIDPPGIDWGDLTEMMGDVPAMAGETLGYVLSKRFPAGGRIWNMMKRAMGVAGGAAGGELVREGVNIDTGAYEHRQDKGWTPSKLVQEPVEAAGLALGGAAVARGLGGMYRGIKSHLTGVSMPEVFRQQGLKLPENMPAAVEEINRFLQENGIDQRFMPDAARILNDPLFMDALDLYAKHRGLEGHEAVKALYDANQTALSSAMDATEAKLGVAANATAYEAGASIGRVAEQGAAKAEAAMEGRVGAATAEAEAATAAVEARGGRVGSDESMGGELRHVAEVENQALKEWADKLYGSLAKEAGGMKFYHSNLLDEATRQGELFSGDISKRLTSENSGLITDIMDNLKVIRETPTGGLYEAPRISSFEQQQRLISQLKRAEREIDKGTLTGIEKSSLTKLRLAAMRDRTERLVQYDNQNKTDLAKRMLDLDREYAVRKDKAARGIMGRLMAYSDGRPRVKDSRVFDSIFGTDKMRAAETREFASVIRDTPEYLPELQELRRSIVEKFIRDNSTGTAGFNPTKAAKWLTDHESNLREFMPQEQLDLLRNAQSKSEVLKFVQQRQKTFMASLGKTIKGRVADMPPSEIFRRLWRSPETIEEARRLLQKSYPQEWDMFMSSAIKRVRADLTGYDRILERPSLDFDKLNKALDDQDYVDKMKALFGDEYVGNLSKIRDAAEILGRNPGTQALEIENPFIQTLRHMIFGPINHRSFAFKSATKYRHELQMDNFMKLVIDPQALNEAAKRATTPEGVKNLQVLIGGSLALGKADSSADRSFSSQPLINDLQNSVRGNPTLMDKVNKALR
jgi:hypothetical protein